MDFSTFQATLAAAQPPPGMNALLRALWLEAKGDFDGAHAIAQALETSDGARIHAYLHRKEGDLPNARYWYSTAGTTAESGSLAAEWEMLVRQFLD